MSNKPGPSGRGGRGGGVRRDVVVARRGTVGEVTVEVSNGIGREMRQLLSSGTGDK